MFTFTPFNIEIHALFISKLEYSRLLGHDNICKVMRARIEVTLPLTRKSEAPHIVRPYFDLIRVFNASRALFCFLIKGTVVFQVPHRPIARLMLRMGIHSGPASGMVVGYKIPFYCVTGQVKRS